MCHPEVPPGAPAPDVVTSEIAVGELPVLVAEPQTGGGAPVVIAPDIFGRSPFYEHLAGRVATAGFTAFLPEPFYRQGPLAEPTPEAAFARRRELDDEQALRDLLALIEDARTRTGAPAVGTIGFCMGGTQVLTIAARARGVATVCFYGFPAGSPGGKGVRPVDLLDDVEGPILGFWGDQDAGVGMDNVEQYVAGAHARGIDIEHTVYEGLGHGFMARSGLDPAHEHYAQACDAWTRTIAFFRERL